MEGRQNYPRISVLFFVTMQKRQIVSAIAFRLVPFLARDIISLVHGQRGLATLRPSRDESLVQKRAENFITCDFFWWCADPNFTSSCMSLRTKPSLLAEDRVFSCNSVLFMHSRTDGRNFGNAAIFCEINKRVDSNVKRKEKKSLGIYSNPKCLEFLKFPFQILSKAII